MKPIFALLFLISLGACKETSTNSPTTKFSNQAAKAISVSRSTDMGTLAFDETKMMTLMVTNSGAETLTGPASLPLGSDFLIGYQSGCEALAVGKTCVVKIVLAAKGKTAGLKTSPLSLDSSVSVELSATIQPAPIPVATVLYSSNSLDFGLTGMTSKLVKTLTIKNVSTLNINKIITVGSSFSKTYDTCSGKILKPKNTCSVKISFDATGKSGTISELLQYGDLPDTVSLLAQVPTPVFTNADLFLIHNTVEHNGNSTVALGSLAMNQNNLISLNLKNKGTASASISSITENDSLGSLVYNNCPSILSEGSSCSLKIAINRPPTGGTFSLTVATGVDKIFNLTYEVQGANPPPLGINFSKIAVVGNKIYATKDNRIYFNDQPSIRYDQNILSLGANGLGYCLALDGATSKCSGTGSATFATALTGVVTNIVPQKTIASILYDITSSHLNLSSTNGCFVESGMAYCSGARQHFKIGNFFPNTGTAIYAEVATAFETATPLTGVKEVYSSDLSTCALMIDETARCWGNNNYGQGGQGTTDVMVRAKQVLLSAGVPLTGVKKMSITGSTVCAIVGNNNQLYCWGGNIIGKVGNLTNLDASYPQMVRKQDSSPLEGVVAMAVGENQTCAATVDKLYCWGSNAISGAIPFLIDQEDPSVSFNYAKEILGVHRGESIPRSISGIVTMGITDNICVIDSNSRTLCSKNLIPNNSSLSKSLLYDLIIGELN